MCVGCMCVCTETHLIRACKYRSLMDQTFTMIRCNVIFNTLQHTATHCNMLQHAATCCNMLQHAATLLQYVVVLQCIRLLDSNRYNVARCNVMLCYTVLQCVAVRYSVSDHWIHNVAEVCVFDSICCCTALS